MSVPKSKRTISEFEAYTNALRIRVHVTEWLLRDFGVKDRYRDLDAISKKAKMTPEDSKALAELLEKYQLGDRICETYPEWWIAERRRSMDRLAASMLENISAAYDIYATCLAEWEERRLLMDRAISNVYQLLDEAQFVISALFKTGGTDVNHYMPFVALCETEIGLIKGWRKSGNEIRRRLVQKDVAERLKIEKKIGS